MRPIGHIRHGQNTKAAGAAAVAGEVAQSFWRRQAVVRLGLLMLLLVLLGGLVWQNKGLFVAAVVNNRPVWRLGLDKRMADRYGQQTIEEIISETLIYQAAQEKGVQVIREEIDGKISEVEKTLGGKITIKDALAMQGMTEADFRRQIELQVLMEKMTAGKVAVSEAEVEEYIGKNKNTLSATDAAGLKAEARKVLYNNKLSSAARDLFSELKNKAKITKFL